MPDSSKLPYLIQLLDDASPVVQEAVQRELASFGPGLSDAIRKLELTPNAAQRDQLRTLESHHKRITLESSWSTWFHLENDKVKLETALNLLSDFHNEGMPAGTLTRMLNELAEEFRATGVSNDSYELAQFLFQKKGLRGGNADYYAAEKSNLVQVIEQRRGNPISLTCIYILVGFRLGLSIDGCNFPGHFLGRAAREGEAVLVDCFNGGLFISPSSFRDLSAGYEDGVANLINTPANAHTIMTRVLNNLANAYKLSDEPELHALIRDLLEMQLTALERDPQI